MANLSYVAYASNLFLNCMFSYKIIYFNKLYSWRLKIKGVEHIGM